MVTINHLKTIGQIHLKNPVRVKRELVIVTTLFYGGVVPISTRHCACLICDVLFRFQTFVGLVTRSSSFLHSLDTEQAIGQDQR